MQHQPLLTSTMKFIFHDKAFGCNTSAIQLTSKPSHSPLNGCVHIELYHSTVAILFGSHTIRAYAARMTGSANRIAQGIATYRVT